MRRSSIGIVVALAGLASSAHADPGRKCYVPESVDLAAIRRSVERTFQQPPKMVPIALPPGDFESCPSQLAAKGACRIGELVIMDASTSVKEAARCDRYPEGTRTWAWTNQTPFKAIAKMRELQPTFEKQLQGLVFLSSFKQTSSASVAPGPGKEQGCPLAYHLDLYVDWWGTGQQWHPPTGGSVFTSYTNMWSMQDWTDGEFFDVADDDKPLGILSHELEHDVCCYIKFKEEVNGSVNFSGDLIGQQGAHWSLYHNTYGQLMYGSNWREEGNGTFYAVPPAAGLRPLDLYLWGLIPAEQVPPVFIVDTRDKSLCTPKQLTLDALARDCAEMQLDVATRCKDDFQRCLTKFDLCLDPPYYRTTDGGCTPHAADEVQSPAWITAKGKKRFVTIQDIVGASGERLPDWKSAYKVNTLGFVLLTNGEPLDEVMIDRLDRFRLAWQRYHYGITGYRLRPRTTLDGADDMSLWEWGGHPEWKDSAELEGWEGVGLKKPISLRMAPPTGDVSSAGALVLELTDGRSGMTHPGLRLDGRRFDALQVVLTVPPPADGYPKLLHGKLQLRGTEGSAEVTFPVYADGKKRTITVHPPQKLIKAATCRGCQPQCRNTGKPDEGWYDSCSGTLIRKGVCKTKEGQQLCGPYCTGQTDKAGKLVDSTLPGDAVEGWYDSCATTLDKTYHTLTILPVADPEAAELQGPVVIDRVDLFKVAEIMTLEETRKKDGEKDFDGDAIVNAYDSCPTVANPSQLDSNDDGKGDACGDFDSDGVVDGLDNCPTVVNSLQQDANNDGIGNACDPSYSAGGCAVAATAQRSPTSSLLLVLLALALVLRSRRR